jgi:hypothetical protein
MWAQEDVAGIVWLRSVHMLQVWRGDGADGGIAAVAGVVVTATGQRAERARMCVCASVHMIGQHVASKADSGKLQACHQV